MNSVEELSNFSFEGWVPNQKTVLCFVFERDEVLLIEKKRGLGAGKVNGPGGKIDPGETSMQATIRECQEEIGITPVNPKSCGELFFQFADGLAQHCEVFRSEKAEGELIETDEAKAFWQPLAEVPYDRMWQDDEFWFPHMVEGKYFKGYFTFDEDRMLSKEIVL
ncbi:MAG: 8-oxo-dGTP diphosphatase [Verrucomicrobiota bacterium]